VTTQDATENITKAVENKMMGDTWRFTAEFPSMQSAPTILNVAT